MPADQPPKDTSMSDQDIAIMELAHVARSLLEHARETGTVPGIFLEAVANKIDFYARFGPQPEGDDPR